jgi:SNF2 family DNA or RNA helicase
VDENGKLADFIVDDDASELEAEDSDGERQPGPSTANGKKARSRKHKSKSKKSKKAKGKEKKKVVTLADLKKAGTRNKTLRQAYLRKLQKDWISSAKIDKTLEILRPIMSEPRGEKVLIFSQWTSLLDLLEIGIYNEGGKSLRYDGSMRPGERADAVDDFRDHRMDNRIMLVSLKAGNAGLNLNMASQVIILDPFWNPYIEEQAIDRAHRLGQTRPVKVHRVLITNTVEDRIIQLQEKKRALISEALDEKASQNIGRLGVQELAYLFGVTHNPNQTIQYVPQARRR